MKKRLLLFLIPLCVSSIPAPARANDDNNWQVPVTVGKDGWLLYRNPRFGFVLPVPPGMKAERPPDNGAGQSFVTADGKGNLVGHAHFNAEGINDLEAAWKTTLEERGATITYKRKTEKWFVVSGVNKNGFGYYERYDANAGFYAGWVFTYPQPDEKKYAPLIERIAKGYDPGLGKGQE